MRRLSISLLSSLVSVVGLVSTSACTDTVLSPSAEETAATPNLARGRHAAVSLSVTPSRDSLSAAEPSTVLRATARNARGDLVKRATITWTSLNPRTASVDAGGKVTAKGVGTALIIAAAAAVADTATVVVHDLAGTVTVRPASVTIPAGDSARLSAVVADSAGNSLSGAAVTWTTSNAGVATVSSSGLVRAVSAGTAFVRATSGAVSASAAVTVTGDAPAPTDPPAPGDSTEAPAPSDSTEPPTPTTCSAYPHDRLVNVSSASQLTAAMQNALPGDLITLAAGTYAGKWTALAAGAATARITLCGPRTAVLDGGGYSSDSPSIRVRGNYWTLDGFTIRNVRRGITVNGADYVRIRRLEIEQIGQEAINLRENARHVLVDSNYIHDTGKLFAQYGEGIYVGSFSGSWSNGVPDRSDSNTVRGNVFGPNIGSELIDVKEGTTGTVIVGNTLDGAGQNPSTTNLNSLVVISGNRVTMTNNRLRNATEHGVIAYVQLSAWGTGHVFHDNAVALSGSTYYGFLLGSGVSGSVVGCDNTVSGARALSNVSCVP